MVCAVCLQVLIDLKPVENGTLYDDFDMLAPKKIKVRSWVVGSNSQRGRAAAGHMAGAPASAVWGAGVAATGPGGLCCFSLIKCHKTWQIRLSDMAGCCWSRDLAHSTLLQRCSLKTVILSAFL